MRHKQIVRTDSSVDDATLLARCRTDPELLGVVYERHAAAVYAYLARRVGAPAAEDLLGDVFVAALAARKRVVPHPSGSALPWLYGIAANLVRRHYRRPRSVDDPDRPSTESEWDAVDARLDAAAVAPELRRVLAELPPTDRQVLLLVAWEQLSPIEAAEALDITPAAARVRLHRARRRAQHVLDSLQTTEGSR